MLKLNLCSNSMVNYYPNLKAKFAKNHAKFLPSFLSRALFLWKEKEGSAFVQDQKRADPFVEF